MRRGDNPVRRSQLVMTYGPGSLIVTATGESVMVAGLEHWFEPWPGQDHTINAQELVFHDPRLEQRLGVRELRLPPDYRASPTDRTRDNYKLPVPVLRFPRWHACVTCGNLRCFAPKDIWTGSKTSPEPTCDHAWSGPGRMIRASKPGRYQVVPLLAVCDAGHVQDFPFRQWVHGYPNPSCTRSLRLSYLGAAIEQQLVACECGAKRDLRGVLDFNFQDSEPSSTLSAKLSERTGPYLCRGLKAWLGAVQEPCGRPLVGILSSATNLYYPDVRTALFIPPDSRRGGTCRQDIVDAIAHPSLAFMLTVVHEHSDDATIRNLMDHAGIVNATLDEVRDAIALIRKERAAANEDARSEQEYDEREFRLEEYGRLTSDEPFTSEFLHIVPQDPGPLARLFSRVALVHRLRESRALVGFSRLLPSDSPDIGRRKRLFWRDDRNVRDWLPGCFVHGEGVFLELHPDRIRELEEGWRQPQSTEWRPRVWDPSASFIALHTLAHLLIRRLSFACGYSAASLRERLYVLSAEKRQMHGLLIYTASGDSEGTMGGLVRASRVESLLDILKAVAEEARWCPGDPVCREIGEPNLSAACYACCYLPETSCECANRYLHRGIVVTDSQASDGLLVRGGVGL